MIQPRRNLIMSCILTGWLLMAAAPAWALITGGTGNTPHSDPGWPVGAAAIFNTPSRVAYWEGPPYGGGQYHAECRGDTAAFQKVLDQFAKLPIDRREVTVVDGVGNSFWLNINRDPENAKDAEIDWVFMVWIAKHLERLQRLPVGLRAPDLKRSPLASLKVYVGGRIDWTAIKVPEGVTVIDNRPTARGYSKADGSVIEGTLKRIDGGQPLAGTVQLIRVEAQPQGGYKSTEVATVPVGDDGKWKFTKVPAGRLQIQANAAGYASRNIGWLEVTEQVSWSEFHGELALPATISGTVVDADGKPLADVTVQCYNLRVAEDQGYDTPHATKATTDAAGRFRLEQMPRGRTELQPFKPGFVRPGLGQPVELPQDNVVLTMIPAAALTVRIDFSKTKRPEQYLVEIEPEGGSKVGSWGGSGQVDPEGVIKFTQIPPGKYVVSGKPNPSSAGEQTAPVLLELVGGKTTEHTIVAK